jgi:hypothetical protein
MSEKYDSEQLQRLWKLDYESLAMHPGESDGSLTLARFVLQAKVALETRSMIKSTFWMAVATFALVFVTIAEKLMEVWLK